MDKNIYKFIFKHPKGQQIFILLVTVISMPFYYAALDIPKLIINSALLADDPAIQGDEVPRPLKILGIEIMDVDQLTLLGSLCVIFLFLVLVAIKRFSFCSQPKKKKFKSLNPNSY